MIHPATLLAQLETRARRRFGQHFLASPAAVDRIVALAGIGPGSRVLEIGPGLGVLTEALLGAGASVVAVEIDRDLAEALRERFAAPIADGALRQVTADALAIDLGELLPGSGWICAANLPYNVGTRILVRLVDMPATFARLVLMLQQEVVERVVAPVGARDRGSLSVYAQSRAEARVGLRLPPGAFHPPPKVDSAVVVLEPRAAPDTGGAPVADFDRLVRVVFSAPRKTLRRVLVDRYGVGPAEAAIAAAGLDPRIRPALLDGAALGRLARALGAASPGPDDADPAT